MAGTVTLALRPAGSVGMDPSDENDFRSSTYSTDANTNQVLREDDEDVFYYDRSASPLVADSAPSSPAYADPYVTVKEMLWLIPGINDVVKKTLGRMEKAFAYNSVYFLKVVLDLQLTYLSSSEVQSASAMLDAALVLKIAEVLSSRLARREKETNSLSRELQLRTLICALSVLFQHNGGLLDTDAYMRLLNNVSERDADNESRCSKLERYSTGENEFLTRYACDLIRSSPNKLPSAFREFTHETVHFIFAEGFVNQLEPTQKETLEAVFQRMTATPSGWHKDLRHLYEGVAGAITMHHQAQSSRPNRASALAPVLAADVARSILAKLEHELKPFQKERKPLLRGFLEEGVSKDGEKPLLSAQLFVCGLLDLLNELVVAFPTYEEVVEEGKALALLLIQKSDKRVFRYKAFEIMISSASGAGEKEYYAAMRSLEHKIEDSSRASTFFDTRTDEERAESLERVQILKKEKREVMDRCEKKQFLFKGAVESMQRRLQGSRAPPSYTLSQTLDDMRHQTPWDDEIRSTTTASPVPSSLPSQVPTLSSMSASCDSAGVSPTATPTFASPACEGTLCDGTLLSHLHTIGSPTDTNATCKSLVSPTDTCHTIFSPVSKCDSPMESPVIPGLISPNTPYEAHEAITPAPDGDLSFRERSQLFSYPGLSMYDDDDFAHVEGLPAKGTNVRMSIELPIQTFDSEDARNAQERMSRPMPFRRSLRSMASDDTLDSSVVGSQVLEEPLHTPITPALSTYPEPSLSRTPSGMTQVGSLKRQTRALNRPRRIRSLQLDKPLPPIVVPERSKDSIIAENAPEPVLPDRLPERIRPDPPRSQSAMEFRNEEMDRLRMNSSTSLSMRTPPTHYPGFTPLPAIIDSGAEPVFNDQGPSIDYYSPAVEDTYKVHVKDSCFSTFISSDARYAVFLSPRCFQIFAIPGLGGTASTRPKFYYRLGEEEGMSKKSKSSPQYRSASASDRYVATITKDQLQVHDLTNDCKVILTDCTKGWEFCSVAIAADRLAVGLEKSVKGDERIGKLCIYRMTAPTFNGLPAERFGKDIPMPINPRLPQDSPHLLSLTTDGNFVSCGTPKFGYYFGWDISRNGEARQITQDQPRSQGTEILTGATLFPDGRQILCSTFPTCKNQLDSNGSFTESVPYSPRSRRPIRQVSLRITHSAVSPYGRGCAFLSKHGCIWITPMAYVEGDRNITSFAPVHSKERVQPQGSPECSGKVAFSPGGDRVIAVDKKGKILIMSFLENPKNESTKAPVTATSPPLERKPSVTWAVKSEVGGYY